MWWPLCGPGGTGVLAAAPGACFSSRPSAEILQANDLLTQGVLLYKQVMEGRVTFGNTVTSAVTDVPVSRGTCGSLPLPSTGSGCGPRKKGVLSVLGCDVDVRAGSVSWPLSPMLSCTDVRLAQL